MSIIGFKYRSVEEFLEETAGLGIEIPLEENTSCLGEGIRLGSGAVLPNRFVIQPVECHDAEIDGSPSNTVFNRYRRYAEGGTGLIWVEACAVSAAGRGHENMLHLHESNLDAFKQLVAVMHHAASVAGRPEPYLILQLHHSGRFGRSRNIIVHNKYLDSGSEVEPDAKVLTDEELQYIIKQYTETAVLAQKAGFDAVDVKCCHGYLLSELLSAYKRPGRYGGSYENRTRLHKEIISSIKAYTSVDIGVRMDVYNPIPEEAGWGSDSSGFVDSSEPECFAAELSAESVRLINISAGIPFIAPWLSRPFNSLPDPPEHPLESTTRLLNLAEKLQKAAPGSLVIGPGFSALKQFGPAAAAAAVECGKISLAGFGRQAIANPNFPADVLHTGGFIKEKTCILCDGCIKCIEDGLPVVCRARS